MQGPTEPGSDAIAFSSLEVGYVIAQHQVWATEDGGTTWRWSWGTGFGSFQAGLQGVEGLPAGLYDVRSVVQTGFRTWWAVAERNGNLPPWLLSTDDSGEHWTVHLLPGVEPSDIELHGLGTLRLHADSAVYESSDDGRTWVRVERDMTTGRVPD